MDVKATYHQRISHISIQLDAMRQRASRLPFIRLGALVVTLAVFFLLFKTELIAPAWIALVAGLAVFGKFVQRDIAVNKQVKRLETLLLINQQEVDSLEGNRTAFDGGDEFIDKTHRYTYDFDIFGDSSLFKLVNRTSSEPGKQRLAKWLSSQADKETVLARQQAVKELSEKIDWRHEFRTAGMLHEQSGNSIKSILAWLGEENQFVHKTVLWVACAVLPPLTLFACVGSFFFVPNAIAYTLVGLQVYFLWKYKEQISNVYFKTSRQVGLLRSYSDLIEQIENQQFESGLLKDLQQKLKPSDKTASQHIRLLVNYLNYMDYKLNILVYVPLALIGMWDFQWLLRLERWKQMHAFKVKNWFDVLAEFEALSSLGNLHHNHPDWIFPEISDDTLYISGKELGHPLIHPSQRVSNDVHIDKQGKILLVTGSNMAGKSTYLRTVGINVVLAFAGAPVCAESFTTSQTGIFTSMRIADSLEDNTSSFYAELKRLKAVIETVEKGENIIFLLDEILRGTNSNDRHTGSKALIQQMIKANGAGILATHDLELGQLEKDFPDNIENWSFDVQVDGEELFFDYKIHPGICTSLNASILMKKMGIKVDGN